MQVLGFAMLLAHPHVSYLGASTIVGGPIRGDVLHPLLHTRPSGLALSDATLNIYAMLGLVC